MEGMVWDWSTFHGAGQLFMGLVNLFPCRKARVLMGSSYQSGPSEKFVVDVCAATHPSTLLPTHTTPCLHQLTFCSLYHYLDAAARAVVHCPRCSHVVTSPHGVCSYCHEHAHQCRECRFIDYAQPDAWLCTECGHSRYARWDVTLASTPVTDNLPQIADGQAYQRMRTALGMLAHCCTLVAMWMNICTPCMTTSAPLCHRSADAAGTHSQSSPGHCP